MPLPRQYVSKPGSHITSCFLAQASRCTTLSKLKRKSDMSALRSVWFGFWDCAEKYSSCTPLKMLVFMHCVIKDGQMREKTRFEERILEKEGEMWQILAWKVRMEKLAFETWSWMHRADNSWCSPSERGQRRRSCHLSGRNWQSRSWWHHFLDSVGRWDNPRKTAPASPDQTA